MHPASEPFVLAVILPLKLWGSLSGCWNAVSYNVYHLQSNLFLDLFVFCIDPQLKSEHGVCLSLVNHTAPIHMVVQTLAILDSLSDHTHYQILPIKVKNVSFKMLPTVPFSSGLVSWIAPLRFNTPLEQTIFLHHLALWTNSFSTVAIVEYIRWLWNVVKVTPVVFYRPECTQLLHVLFPCVRVLSARYVLPKNPLCTVIEGATGDKLSVILNLVTEDRTE